ncbi:hypothetical protein [Halobacterium salinarum]|uniref:hypothetical protein n=1 Tax=Halobacterium salinarum TaxID=2242 RepID=UPI001F4242E5|nr:hypothetical protein [Halobacterium salinarum]MCF2166068.1 hypothetical protein [Halobacterium salinarum]MCF2166838.1 hypothetical protein [Halobacterium salinarum]
MADWSRLNNIGFRILFLLLGISMVYAALVVLGGGSGMVILLVLAFTSFSISAGIDKLNIKFRGHRLGLGEPLSEGYQGLIEHANKSSEGASRSLRKVKRHSDSEDPFHDLSSVIDAGIQERNRTSVASLLEDLNSNIQTKKYIESFEDTGMKVVRFENDELWVNSEGRSTYLKRNMKFRIYREKIETSNESAEPVDDHLGVASVIRASKRTTKMKMERWTTSLEDEEVQEIRGGEGGLKGKRVFADVYVSEGVAEASLEELEEAYQQLKPIRSEP